MEGGGGGGGGGEEWGRRGGGGGAVNNKEHYSMAVEGNTNFTDFKSSENKISGGNCNDFVRLLRYNTARPPPASYLRGRDLKENPGRVKCLLVGCLTSQQQASVSQGRRRGQSYTVTLVAFGSKPRFTQKNKVDVCMHHMITNVSFLVSN